MKIFISAIICLVVTACAGSKNPLLGTWRSTSSQPLTVDVDFVDDSNFKLLATGELAGMYRIEATGKYTYDGKNITLRGETVSATVDGKPMPAEALKNFEKGFKEEVGGPLIWNGRDEFSYTDKGNTSTYRRVGS